MSKNTIQPALLCFFLLIFNSLQAADRTWEGDVSTDWNDPNNWDGNTLPADDDDIFIDPTNYTNAPVLSAASAFDPDDIFIDNGAVFTISGTGSLTVNDDIFVDASTLNIGGSSLDVDEIEAANGSNVNMTAGTITMTGDIDANSNSTFTISTTVTQTDTQEDINIGNGASIIVQTGANVTGFDDIDFDGATTGGTYTQTGGSVSVTDEVKFADGDDNTMTVSGGTLNVADDIEIETDNNNITFNGTADINIGGDIEFGNAGPDATNSTVTVGGNADVDITGDLNFFGNGNGNGFIVTNNGTVDVGDIDDFTDVTVLENGTINHSGGSILPVELISFTAEVTLQTVKLAWTTATEINNDYFEVQRADSNLVFSTIATVEGNGNTSGIIDYTFQDRFPMPGPNYYRLKQVDFDGENEIHETVFAHVSSAASNSNLRLFPNPVMGNEFIVRSNQTKTQSSATIRLLDLKGNIILSRNLDPLTTGWVIKDFRQQLTSGTYLVEFNTDSYRETTRIVIQ